MGWEWIASAATTNLQWAEAGGQGVLPQLRERVLCEVGSLGQVVVVFDIAWKTGLGGPIPQTVAWRGTSLCCGRSALRTASGQAEDDTRRL